MTELFSPAASALPLPALSRHIYVVGGRLLCSEAQFVHVSAQIHQMLSPQILGSHYLGDLEGAALGVHLLSEEIPAQGTEWRGLRSLLGKVDDALFALAGRAVQVAAWDLDHRFCGRCGSPTVHAGRDRARHCAACNHSVYPRISPCVIMLVTRGEECLLAQHSRHNSPFFTALAGFIEAGESAEEALEREVLEEVGLRVGRPHYIGSQSWPFPGQLMLGYLVPWVGGVLAPDPEEISRADWFHYRELPDRIPPVQTLSGQLIREFVRRASAEWHGGP